MSEYLRCSSFSHSRHCNESIGSPSQDEPEPSIGHSPGHKEVMEAELTETGPPVQGKSATGGVTVL